MPRKRILFAGSAEICFSVDAPGNSAGSLRVSPNGKYAFSPGGQGLLTSVAASRLGYDAVFCGRVGDDYYGDRLIGVCRSEGLHVSNVTTDRELQTGMALTLLEDGRLVRTVRLPGANKTLSGAQIEDAMSCYPDAVSVSADLPLAAVLRASSAASMQGLPFFFDADTAGADLSNFPFERLSKTEILLINELDADAFAGESSAGNEEEKKTACYNLCKRFPVKYVVLKLGKRGCFIYDGKYFSAIVSSDSDPLDPAGASEAFTAALIGEYLETGDLEKAARFANNISLLTASRIGAMSSLPTKEEAKYLR
ncbi:MAG: hypothetical protein II715_04975 [Clostridia bacterium]|nr:hypothetical protein [Clostridia bacterium]